MSRLLLPALLLGAVLPAQSQLVTTFAHDSAGLPNGAVYFDLDVTAHAITIPRLDLNLSGTGVVEIYTLSGSRVGFWTFPPLWTLRGAAFVTGATAGAPTTLELSPFSLPQGTHGVAIRGIGVQQFFTVGNGSNQTHTTPHVTLRAGEATNLAFAPPIFSPRVVNCALHYLVGAGVPLPPHLGNGNGNSRGFKFTAPVDCNIRQLALPAQVRQPGDTASYLVRIDGAVAYRSIGNAGAVEPGLRVRVGQQVEVLGNWTPASPGSNSAHASVGPTGTFATLLGGAPVTLTPAVWTWDIGDPAWTPNGGTGFSLPIIPAWVELGRVLMTTEPGELQATNTALGSGCGLVAGSCYQRFANGAAFDLDFSAVTFTPQAGGGYVVDRSGALLPVGATGVAAVVPLGDGDEVTVPLTLGSFPGWTAITVGANGYVARAPGNATAATPTAQGMLNAPREAFWSWHDFDPTATGGGRVKMEQSAARVVVTWDGVWHDNGVSAAAASTAQIQLHADGRVTIAWGTVASQAAAGPHVVGYSPGGPSPDPGATDFSVLGGGVVVLAATEQFPVALGSLSRPVVGTAWSLRVERVPATTVIGVDVLGLGDPGVAELGGIGMPGCGLRASLDVLAPWVPVGATHDWSFGVPNATSLRGTSVYATSVVFTFPALNAFGALTTNGIRGLVGDL